MDDPDGYLLQDNYLQSQYFKKMAALIREDQEDKKKCVGIGPCGLNYMRKKFASKD